jgi:protein-disulfide isomerase
LPAKGRKTAQKSGTNLKTFYWVLGGIAIIGLGAIAWSALKPNKAATAPIQLSEDMLKNNQALVQAAHSMSEGPEDAPIRMLVFSDFTCPACRQFSTAVEPGVRSDFISKGKVQIKYYDFPLGGGTEHKWGFLAARAARCAGDQNKFWEFHDALFRDQPSWAYGTKSPSGDFEKYITEVGGDANAFKACLNSDKHADVVTANHALGEQLGVNSTPSIFMNGRQLGQEWRDYGLMKARLEKELGISAPAPAATTTTTQ